MRVHNSNYKHSGTLFAAALPVATTACRVQSESILSGTLNDSQTTPVPISVLQCLGRVLCSSCPSARTRSFSPPVYIIHAAKTGIGTDQS